MDNELFGHVQGAFTDASSAQQVLIAKAEGGTICILVAEYNYTWF